MRKYLFLSIAFLLILTVSEVRVSHATPINLNSLIADATVSVSPDGMMVVFSEDPSLFSVALRQDPFAIPFNAKSISFNYDLKVLDNNEDYFHAYLADSSGFAITGYDFSIGGYAGSYTGNIFWDLTGSLLLGTSVGLVFDMSAGFDDLGYESTLTLSNVDLTSTTTPVPEPETITLLLVGFAGLGYMAKNRRKI